MNTLRLSHRMSSTLAAMLIVIAFPSFFYQKFGKNLSSVMTYFNGGVLGLSFVFQEPILLVINPLLAIVGMKLPPPQKGKEP